MELEKAKALLKEMQETNRAWLKETKEENCEKIYLRDIEAIETVLQALDNSISKEKVRKIEKYCKSKSKFQTFGDEQLERAIAMYVNRTKSDILNLLEE